MHFTNIITAVAALASTAMAAPATDVNDKRAMVPSDPFLEVAVEMTKGIGPVQPKSTVMIPMGRLTRYPGYEMTKLQVRSLEMGGKTGIKKPDVNDVVCQRYLDKFGSRWGSERFTKKKQVLVDTNNVDMGWILCYINGEPGDH